MGFLEIGGFWEFVLKVVDFRSRIVKKFRLVVWSKLFGLW
jgi:hypothetical protein